MRMVIVRLLVLDRDRRTAGPRFGFGLSIVGVLAELYGGSIALSEAPLGGLRATLELPHSPPRA
jgi:signal transduction histidine kinase